MLNLNRYSMVQQETQQYWQTGASTESSRSRIWSRVYRWQHMSGKKLKDNGSSRSLSPPACGLPPLSSIFTMDLSCGLSRETTIKIFKATTDLEPLFGQRSLLSSHHYKVKLVFPTPLSLYIELWVQFIFQDVMDHDNKHGLR